MVPLLLISFITSSSSNIYYKQLEDNNKLLKCSLENECIINRFTNLSYNKIKECAHSCSINDYCKGYIYYNSTLDLYNCNTLHKLGFKNLEGLENNSIHTINKNFLKKKKKCRWWCENHKTSIEGYNYKVPTSWNMRCNWESHFCSGCPQCNTLNKTCEIWCGSHNSSWEEKCGWNEHFCSACKPCENITNSSDILDPANTINLINTTNTTKNISNSSNITDYIIDCGRTDLEACNNTYMSLCTENKSIIHKIIRFYCPYMCGICTTSSTTSSTSSSSLTTSSSTSFTTSSTTSSSATSSSTSFTTSSSTTTSSATSSSTSFTTSSSTTTSSATSSSTSISSSTSLTTSTSSSNNSVVSFKSVYDKDKFINYKIIKDAIGDLENSDVYSIHSHNHSDLLNKMLEHCNSEKHCISFSSTGRCFFNHNYRYKKNNTLFVKKSEFDKLHLLNDSKNTTDNNRTYLIIIAILMIVVLIALIILVISILKYNLLNGQTTNRETTNRETNTRQTFTNPIYEHNEINEIETNFAENNDMNDTNFTIDNKTNDITI